MINSTVIPSKANAAQLVDGITTGVVGTEIAISQNYQDLIADLAIGCIFAESSAGLVLTAAQADYFSQAAGKESTINSGASTTTFNINKHNGLFGTGSSTVDNNGQALTTPGTTTLKWGCKITATTNCTLQKVTLATGATATTVYLCDSSRTTIVSASVVAGVATFSHTLTSGTSYYILTDSTGASYTTEYTGTISLPITGTNINWIGGYLGEIGDTSNQLLMIQSLTFAVTEAPIYHIVTNALSTLNGSYEFSRLHLYKLVLPTGANLTYDIDINGDGTYEFTGLTADQWNDLSAAQTYASAVIRINLNQGTAANGTTASVAGYCVMVD